MTASDWEVMAKKEEIIVNIEAVPVETDAPVTKEGFGIEDSSTRYPTRARQVYICILLALATGLAVLDANIIVVSIPSITKDLKSLRDIGWYSSTYFLGNAMTQLLWGNLYTLYSPKYLFIAALSIRQVACLFCALARSSPMFIIGRFLDGCSKSGILGGALVIVSQTLPLRWRSALNGACGMLYALAFAGGPTLGGIITVEASWRWCFWLGLILGVPVLLLACFVPKNTTTKATVTFQQQARNFDWLGLCFLSVSLVCGVLGLQWGGVLYQWSSAQVLCPISFAGLCFIIFFVIEYKQKAKALLPLRIIRQRTVAASALYAFTLSASCELVIYYAPVWFQVVKGVSALKSGIFVIPLTAADALSGLVAGLALAWVGYYTPLMLLSSGCAISGAALLTKLQQNTTTAFWASALVLTGLGNGIGFEQSQISVQTVLSGPDISLGIGFVLFAQTLGPVISLTVAENIFLSTLKPRLESDSNGDVIASAMTYLSSLSGEDLASAIAAFNFALQKVFMIAVAAASSSLIAACFVEMKSVNGAEPDGNDQALRLSIND